ncbi:MAG: FemAB family PEP-CTERM system-associated protein [Planctomycetes bacterium]|nr:FemAB family PEP-CTERM system-associated protein [Planctomycetota bacterium]
MTTRTDQPGPADSDVQPVSVELFQDADAASWAAYVSAHPHGTLFHTLRWRDAIRGTFQHLDRYLVARKGAEICGILPLTKVSSVFFGTTMVSVPFGVYGGMLVDDEGTARALVDRARQLATECGAKYVEMRHLHAPIDDLPRTNLYFTFIADIPDSPEGCLQRIPRKARAEVRKSLADERLSFEEEGLELKDFHRLFSLNKRRLGSPLFPSSLFWHLRNQFQEDCRLHVVRAEGEVISAVMSFIHEGMIMPYYSGSVDDADTNFRASNFMYYKLMEWASDRGLKRFDFGRSREDTGAYRFKKHQGFEPFNLSYDYILAGDDEIPSLNPSNPKYRIAQKLFRNLPLFAAQKLGSWLVKRAPF